MARAIAIAAAGLLKVLQAGVSFCLPAQPALKLLLPAPSAHAGVYQHKSGKFYIFRAVAFGSRLKV